MIDTASDPSTESHFMNVSVRAWLAIILVLTCCAFELGRLGILAYMIANGAYDLIPDAKIVEPLYSALLLTLGFYFGQKKQTP